MEKKVYSAIGPNIGFVNSNQLRITISLPKDLEVKKMTLKLLDENNNVKMIDAQSDGSCFNQFFYVLETLEEDKKYSYSFYVENSEIKIEFLNKDDLYFYKKSTLNGLSIGLVSCNNPFEFKDTKITPYNMWEKFDKAIIRKDTNLIIYAGDQVYNDSVEAELLTLLKTIDNKGAAHKILIDNYMKFWGNPAIKKLHAQVPSLMMWDDHDITDGWGGRPESFSNEKNFKTEWNNLFKTSQEIFKAYQASLNPIPLYSETFTSYLDLGITRIYLMDFRSEKNIKKHQLMSEQHLESFFKSLDAIPENIINIAIVSPVVPVRINPELEKSIEALGTALYQAREKTTEQSNGFWRWLSSLFTKSGLTDISDDSSDSLTSEYNLPTFVKILKKLYPLISRDKKVLFLSGDIHAGGFSEIIFQNNDRVITIPQVVSSPIAYQPMNKNVKNNSTTEAEIALFSDDKINIWARNKFYISQRNFALLKFSEDEVKCNLHLESHRIPFQEVLFSSLKSQESLKG